MSTFARRSFFATLPMLLLLDCGAALASGHQGAYAGGGLGFATTYLSNDALTFVNNPDRSVVVVEGHGGYRFIPYFALEGEILGAANGNNNAFQRISFAGFSGRAVVIAPVSTVVDLYALAGFYTGSAEAGVSDTEHESGGVYGAGIQLNFGARGQYGVRGEYIIYDGSQLLDQIKGFTVSFQYNFFN